MNPSQRFRSVLVCVAHHFTNRGYQAIQMIRKGQGYGSVPSAKVGLVDRFISRSVCGNELRLQLHLPD
jgi:hypothetical protein